MGKGGSQKSFEVFWRKTKYIDSASESFYLDLNKKIMPTDYSKFDKIAPDLEADDTLQQQTTKVGKGVPKSQQNSRAKKGAQDIDADVVYRGMGHVMDLCPFGLALCFDEKVREKFSINVDEIPIQLKVRAFELHKKIDYDLSRFSRGEPQDEDKVLLIDLVHDAVIVLFSRYACGGNDRATGLEAYSAEEREMEPFIFHSIRNKSLVHDVNNLQTPHFFLSPDGSSLLPSAKYSRMLSSHFFTNTIAFCNRYRGSIGALEVSENARSVLEQGLPVYAPKGSLSIQDIGSVVKSEDKKMVETISLNVLSNAQRLEDLSVAQFALDSLKNVVLNESNFDHDVRDALYLVFTISFFTRVYLAISKGVRSEVVFDECEKRYNSKMKVADYRNSIFALFKAERNIAHHSQNTNLTGFLFSLENVDAERWCRTMSDVVSVYREEVAALLCEDTKELSKLICATPSALSELKKKVAHGNEVVSTYNEKSLKTSRNR